MIASGAPKMLRDTSPDPKVREFLTRGEADVGTPEGGQQPCSSPWERGERE